MQIGIFGAGSVGTMLALAHARFGSGSGLRLAVANRSRARLHALVDLPSIEVGTPEHVASIADIFVACVPNAALSDVARWASPRLPTGAVFVCTSSAARLADLGALLPHAVAKVVPSVLHVVGRGAALVIAGPRCTQKHLSGISQFLKSFSRPEIITDQETRVATDISSCGPALIAACVAQFAEAGARRQGAPSGSRLAAIAQETLCGLGQLLDEGWSLARIVEEVATPGGTTEAGLNALDATLPAVLDSVYQATDERQRALRLLATR